MAIGKIDKGALHRKMHKKPGSKISMSALEAEKAKAKREHNVKLEREAQFAINARHFDHSHKRSE